MKKFRNIAFWIVGNGFWYGMAALGMAGIGWAWNIFAFLTWLVFIIVSLVWYGMTKKFPDVTMPPRTVPGWLDVIFDAILTIALAATGHWFYAALVVIHIYEYQHIFDLVKKEQERLRSSTDRATAS